MRFSSFLLMQIINVYNQEYESAASFWPDVHGRIITALVFSQLVLMGLMSTKGNAQSTPLLIVLLVLTIWFHFFCKGRYEPAFVRNPLQVRRYPNPILKRKQCYICIDHCFRARFRKRR